MLFTLGVGAAQADAHGIIDQKYIDLMKSKGLGCSSTVPCTATGTDQDLLLIGRKICDALRGGRSEQALINFPVGGVVLPREQAGLLIGISEAAFCPGISAPPAQPA